MAISFDLGAVTAYSVAVQNGYEGTIEEWAKGVAEVVGLQTEVSKSVDDASSAANDAKGSARSAQNYSNNVLQAIGTIASRISPPINASTASDMSDTTKIYIYTGSESGYVNGDWYYYDGTKWVDGGAYGQSYDYDGVKKDIESLNSLSFDLFNSVTWEVGGLTSSGEDASSSVRYRTKGMIPITSDIESLVIGCDSDYRYSVYPFDATKSFISDISGFASWRTSNLSVKLSDIPTVKYVRIQMQKSNQTIDGEDYVHMYGTYANNLSDLCEIVDRTNYLATYGRYNMPLSSYARKRANLSSGNVVLYNATYRVSPSDFLILTHDVKIVLIDSDFIVYGYVYTDGWHYFSSGNGELPIIPAGTRFIFTILRTEEDTSETADIEEFISSIYFLTNFGIEVNNLQTSYSSLLVPKTDILLSNDDAVNKIWASRWLRSSTAKPLTLLWFSDIHRWTTPLERIIQFKNYLTDLGILNDAIVTGDLVRNSSDEESAFNSFWTNTTGTEDILIALGNHDHYDVGSQPHGKASFSKMDGLFFQTIDNWDVVRQSNYPFYYKDYDDEKVRLIIADPAVTSDEADETTWLEQTLDGAKTLGYSVIIASHFLVTQAVSIYDNDWSNNLARDTATDSMSYDWNGCDIVSCVTDFINDGGKFLCYMIGHTHTDIVSYVANHPEQLIINVASASADREHETPLTTNDLPRYENSRTQDCFNVITFDAENSIIKCVRVGANINMYQQPRTAFAYDCNTNQFISLI